jgi:hypothetical protein
MFLPRIGLPKTRLEKFNREVLEEAVGHYSYLYFNQDQEAFEKKYALLPESKRIQNLENEVVKLIDSIERHSFYGVENFRNSYYVYIEDILNNKTTFHSEEFFIGHITHGFLKNLNWNLHFSEQDYRDASESDGPDYVFLIQNTDLFERFPEINEMASMLAHCARLLVVKRMLAELEKQEEKLSYSDELVKKITIKLSNSIKLATNPDDVKKLYEYFLQDDLSVANSTVMIGCTNEDLWYILFKFREMNEKFRVVKIANAEFFKSTQGTVLKQNHINRAKNMNPPHKALIDKIFSEK